MNFTRFQQTKASTVYKTEIVQLACDVGSSKCLDI